VDGPMDCETFRGWICHFQADEIPASERREFESHLDGCADCARVLEVERGFLDALKDRLPRQAAPPGLETRVRAALHAEAPDPARLAWYRTPWFAATAAALLLLVILVPSLPTDPPGPAGAPGEVTHVVAQDVTVVDLDCDRAGMSLEYLSLEADLDERLSAAEPGDLERELAALRQFRHRQVLRVAAADISEAALEDLIIMIMDAEDSLGLKIALSPRSLHIPTELFFEANRILKSTLRVHTGDNDPNIIKDTGQFPGGIKLNHFFTDADAFFIRTNAPDGMKHYQRHKIDLEQDNDFDTKNAKAASYDYYSFGWSDWLGVFGSPGA